MGIIGHELTLFFIQVTVLGHHLDSLVKCTQKILRTDRLVDNMKGNNWE